jgi:hypothetical protein
VRYLRMTCRTCDAYVIWPHTAGLQRRAATHPRHEGRETRFAISEVDRAAFDLFRADNPALHWLDP